MLYLRNILQTKLPKVLAFNLQSDAVTEKVNNIVVYYLQLFVASNKKL